MGSIAIPLLLGVIIGIFIGNKKFRNKIIDRLKSFGRKKEK